jgi:hypothetical protein
MAGMESNNLGLVGLMDQHMSHNALFRQDKALFTTLLSQVKEAHFYGMHISLG